MVYRKNPCSTSKTSRSKDNSKLTFHFVLSGLTNDEISLTRSAVTDLSTTVSIL